MNDAFNAAYVKGDMSDYTMYYGRGAGRAPTASTVIGDIGDIARNLAYDETRYARGVPNYAEGKVRLRAAGDIRSKYYLRFMLADRPGAMGVVASALGESDGEGVVRGQPPRSRRRDDARREGGRHRRRA